jgi:hypothetical protein
MTEGARHAACPCGQLQVTCTGDPVRISVCHCLDCQRRSGSAFAAQVRYPADQVEIAGKAHSWTRIADSGNAMTFHFCPHCGATLWFQAPAAPETIAVPIGAFADPTFPAPWFSVYEDRQHPWLRIVGEGIERD